MLGYLGWIQGEWTIRSVGGPVALSYLGCGTRRIDYKVCRGTCLTRLPRMQNKENRLYGVQGDLPH